MKNYRIKELNGEFTIQIKVKDVVLSFFARKEIYNYKDCNTKGNVLDKSKFSLDTYYIFKTLEEAKKQVELFEKGNIYYY